MSTDQKSSNSQKPTLALVPGSQSQDLETLRKLYVQLTGKDPTPAELEEARAMLQNAQN